MLSSAVQLSVALLKAFHAPHRSEKVRYVLNHLRWLEENDLPVEYLCRLFPGVVEVGGTADTHVDHPFELPYGERLVLSCLAAGTAPRLIFEFGTFTGATTRLLADAAPGAEVHTIDLPDREITSEPWLAEMIGGAFRRDPKYRDRIIQHRDDTRRFDYERFRGRVDLIYVDASHDYEDVLHDSRRALEMLSERGLIVWDDYQPAIPGVVSALRELRATGVPLVRIAESRLVVHRSESFPQFAGALRNERAWSAAPVRGRPESMTSASLGAPASVLPRPNPE